MYLCAIFLEQSVHFFGKRIRNNITAGTDKFHLAEITFEIACFVYLLEEIRHAEYKADFVLFDSIGTHLSVKLWEQGLRHTGNNGNMHTHTEAEAVKNRKRREHTILIGINNIVKNGVNNIGNLI